MDISIQEEWGQRAPSPQTVAIGAADSIDADLLERHPPPAFRPQLPARDHCTPERQHRPATALAVLTGEPQPLAIKDPGTGPSANTGIDLARLAARTACARPHQHPGLRLP